MEKKYGVYICKGCGIADTVDIEKLSKAAKRGTIKDENIKVHDILCSPESKGCIIMVDEMGYTRGIHGILTAEDSMVNLTGPRAFSEPPEFIIFPASSRRIA